MHCSLDGQAVTRVRLSLCLSANYSIEKNISEDDMIDFGDFFFFLGFVFVLFHVIGSLASSTVLSHESAEFNEAFTLSSIQFTTVQLDPF